MNASSSKGLQFPKVKFYSTDFCFIGLHRCVERAHPLAEKLNKLIKEGKIPEECLFYKYLNDTTSFAMIDSSKASDFHWDHEVCEFFETVKYLGGQRTRNFLRGPGFHGTGRGGKKQFTTFADFNLCGPSHNVSNRCKAGYTTDSGIIKPHLQSFHVFSSHPKADINYLVSSDQVQVIGVSLTMDGTALKPGLEFDTRQKRIIGLTYKVDWNYVCDNPVPKPEEIKANLITSAEVTFMTSVDNSSTMPVGVHYHPKSVSGQDILSQMLGMAKTVQACDRCLNKQPAKNHIVTHNTSLCNSTKCDRCLQMKAVCQECQRKGHLSYLPALRSCESCLEESVQCRKVAVLAVVTDCEECNKQALLEIQKMSENNTMPPELLLLTPLPDVVHIGKSLKCSWSNWFIDLNGQMSNLVLIRTLRDSTDSDVRKPLRKMLTLECVRNKDRMAVEPIVRLSRPEVIEVLSKVSLVVHTLVPEKYRFWASNQKGVCCHPVAICPGPLGSVLALDYDFDTSCSRLLKIRLHQPADVAELQNGLKDSRDLCFSRGVAYIAERGNACIRFEDLNGKVRLNPNSLRSRADLERTLTDYNLSIEGTVPTLRNRLSQHLLQLEARVTKNMLQTDVPLSMPAAVCVASDDLLLCADDGHRVVYQIQLERNGVTINGKLRKLIGYPEGIHRLESLTLSDSSVVYFAAAKSPHCNGGLYCFDIESSEVTNVLGNMTDNCREIKKVARFKETLVFTDVGGRQVKRYNPTTKEVETLAGDGCEGAQDGTEKSCSFVQVHGVCSVSDSVFTTDAAAGKIKLLTGLSGTTDFLKHLGILYDTFGITCKAATSQPITPEQVIQNLNTVDGYIKATVMNVKETNNLKENSTTNGPQGTVSQKTQTSIELLLNGVKSLVSKVTVVNPSYKDTIDWKTLLTTIVENLHAVSHFKHETFDVLQYATDFGTISKESLKRITKWGAKYFTHPSSYYPVPQTGMAFKDIQYMTPLPPDELSKREEETMKDWVENYRPVRQRTVRSETTKDKAGALPPAVYSNSNTDVTTRVSFQADQVEETPAVSSDMPSAVTDVPVLNFVSDATVPQLTLASTADYNQVEEYESDSDDSDNDVDIDSEELVIGKPVMTRSGRQVRVWTRFDV